MSAHRLQPGIYVDHRAVPRSHYGIAFLHAAPDAHAAEVRAALSRVEAALDALRRGEVAELPGHPVPHANLDTMIAHGPRAFRIAGWPHPLPAELAPAFQFCQPPTRKDRGLLPGAGLRYADDVLSNGADAEFAVQLFADTGLAVARALVEMRRALRGTPLRIGACFDGFSREDHRSWIGFHDAVSNLEPGEERLRAIAVKPTNRAEDEWTVGGTYLAFLRFAIDLEAWDKLDRPAQELIVGRDKLTGAPIASLDASGRPVAARGCPMHARGEVFPPPENAVDPPDLEPPDVEEEILRLSHAQRANHHRRDVENRDSLRIYRQTFEAIVSAENGPRAEMNFTCYMDTPERVVRLLTQPGWLGKVNFGGDLGNQPGGLTSMVQVRAAGVFLVGPVVSGS